MILHLNLSVNYFFILFLKYFILYIYHALLSVVPVTEPFQVASLNWDVSTSQGLDCSPMKAVRELGSERREAVWSIPGAGVRVLKGVLLSTRGPGVIHLSAVIVPTVNAGYPYVWRR
jgi:hypothetical protein